MASQMNHLDRIERVIVGALKSAIDAHGPITLELIGSAAKRIVGQLEASRQTRVPIPVVTAAEVVRVERLADRFEALISEVADGVVADLAANLSILRAENHPEGWTEIEVIEHADTPIALLHHYTVGPAPKQYQRKRDGKTVELVAK